jgi:dienelactone hydrolase
MHALTLMTLLAAAPTPADQAAQALITDLREGHPDVAFPRLGAKMQAAITGDALLAAWKQTTEGLGAFKQLELLQAFDRQGLQGLVYAARYERGSIQVTAAVDPTSLKVEGFFMKPLPNELPPEKAPAPASYVTPDAFGSFDVKVGKAPFELGGTVTVPKGKGPFPAVVLVHGSGPNDRDETIGANKPFKDLAEGLSSKGVVVLRYDKRTLVYGRQYAGKDITFDEELIDDAVAAVTLLKARTDVDAARVYVVGHSLGALFAPAVAAKVKVAGLALLAPSFRKPWDILPQQLKYLGVPADKVAEVEAAFSEVRAGRAKGMVLNAPASYWKAWAAYDGPGTAKKLKVPVLVLHGSRDYQVIDVDFVGWKKALAGVKDAQLVELPGLNHLFIAGEGPSKPTEYDTPSHVAVEVIDQLARFCH